MIRTLLVKSCIFRTSPFILTHFPFLNPFSRFLFFSLFLISTFVSHFLVAFSRSLGLNCPQFLKQLRWDGGLCGIRTMLTLCVAGWQKGKQRQEWPRRVHTSTWPQRVPTVKKPRKKGFVFFSQKNNSSILDPFSFPKKKG